METFSSFVRGTSGRWRRGVALLALLLAAATAGHAQTADDALRFSERFPAAGARMVGMAGAGIAGVADFSALYTNPAGLGYLQSSQAVGSFSFVRAVDEARYEASFGNGGPSVANSTRRVGRGDLGSAGLAYKLPTARGSLVLAGGVNQTGTFQRTLGYAGTNGANSITDAFLPRPGNFDVRSNGDLVFDFDTPLLAYNAGAIEFVEAAYEDGDYPFIQAVTPGTTIDQVGEVVEEGRLTEAAFGGAVEAAKGVMTGASVNVSFGTYRFARLHQEFDAANENTPGLYEVLLNDGSFLRGFDQLDVDERITSELVGVSVRGGLTADLAAGVRAGLVVETPTWYAINETFGTRMITYFDEPSGEFLEAGATDANEFDYTIQTPWRIGSGLALDFGEVRVAGDVEYVDWTQLSIEADGVDFSDVNRRIRNFEPVFNWRIGAEYRLDPFTLRGGVAHQPDPRDVEIQLPGGETTDRSKTFYAAGFSYRLGEQFRLDFGWIQEQFDDQYRPYASVEVPGEFDENGEPVEIVAPYVDEEVIRNRFLIGIAYSF